MVIFVVLLLSFALALGSIDKSEVFYGYHGPTAPLSSDGIVIDTPEVADAKAAHLAAYAAAEARVHLEPVKSIESNGNKNSVEEKSKDLTDDKDNESEMKDDLARYHGPLAPIGEDGRVIDTPEVARAKAVHLAVHSKALAKVASVYESGASIWDTSNDNHLPALIAYSTHYHPESIYRGPPAPLDLDGRVIDTPEVLEAKAAHLRAHAHAVRLIAHKDPLSCY